MLKRKNILHKPLGNQRNIALSRGHLVSRLSAFCIVSYYCLLKKVLPAAVVSTKSVQASSLHLHITHTHTHTHFMALCPQLPQWASNRKVKPICILLKQETVSDNGISWAVCKSAPCSRQRPTPAAQHPTNEYFFTSRMPFLPLNQQRRSTKDFHLHITSKI